MRRLLSSRAGLAAVAGAVALAIAAGLVVASEAGKEDGVTAPSPALVGVHDVAQLLDGIPQRGNVLGDANAPVTLVEYADLQCPYCALWATQAFPEIVRDYVRPGKVQIVFRGMAFLGPDSIRALRTVLAAGERNRAWHLLDVLFTNQGEENSGWADDALLRAAAAAVGLDAGATLAASESPVVSAALAEHGELAAARGIDSTPSFEIGRSGGELTRLRLEGLDAASMRPALDAALTR